jgi:hypothetical protein
MPHTEERETSTESEFRAFAYKGIAPSDNGNFARIVYLARDHKTELPVQLAADLLDKMMPALLGVAAECTRRRNGQDLRQVYKIRQGEVSKSPDGRVVFEFAIPTGQQFSFEMDREGATLILDSLSAVLALAERQIGKVDPPQRH